MALYKVLFQDGSTDVLEAPSAAKARDKGEADYGEVARVTVQPDVDDDVDGDEEEDGEGGGEEDVEQDQEAKGSKRR
ncbi:MAG: hypothetical protein NTW87_08835 [Planctomycetota bacterium]|nr:hypothetical protein [Planctomycetota bacterium]